MGERRPAKPRHAGAGRTPPRSGRGAALTRRDAGGGAGRAAAWGSERAAALEEPARALRGGVYRGGRYMPPDKPAVSGNYRHFNWR